MEDRFLIFGSKLDSINRHGNVWLETSGVAKTPSKVRLYASRRVETLLCEGPCDRR